MRETKSATIAVRARMDSIPRFRRRTRAAGGGSVPRHAFSAARLLSAPFGVCEPSSVPVEETARAAGASGDGTYGSAKFRWLIHRPTSPALSCCHISRFWPTPRVPAVAWHVTVNRPGASFSDACFHRIVWFACHRDEIGLVIYVSG